MPYKNGPRLQPYPREEDGLARKDMFPRLTPPLNITLIRQALEVAFQRTMKDKRGEELKKIDTPEKLVKTCLDHLKQRNDPILSLLFFSQLNAVDIFDMDGIPHEMQRYRMKIGLFYQYLLIELARVVNSSDSNIIGFFDGSSSADVSMDVKTPGFEKGLRLYISVKKSVDTVGGQDMGGVILKLEEVAKKDKNLNSPYLCVIAIATPMGQKMRYIRHNADHHPYSMNCEFWFPDFIYPYLTGHPAATIYKEAAVLGIKYLPFYSLHYRSQCSELLKEELIKKGIAKKDGNIIKEEFSKYLTRI